MSHLTVQLLIIGIGTGSAFALAALGIVVTYKGSGVLNFAHGAIGMVGTFVYADLLDRDWPVAAAFAAGIAVSAGIGCLFFLVVIRHMTNATVLAKVVATLGLMLTLQEGAVQVFGTGLTSVPSPLTTSHWTIGGYIVPVAGVEQFVLAAAITIALTWFYHRRIFGMAVEASAIDEESVRRFGYSPVTLGAVNWALGGALAAIAGILLVAALGLNQGALTALTITILPAAILGGFRSLSQTFIAAIFIGIVTTQIVNQVTTPGVVDVVPFALVVVALLLRSDAIPGRGSTDVELRLPAAPLPHVRPLHAASLGAVVVAAGLLLDSYWRLELLTGFGYALVGLSVVLLTGYLGQLSLAQWTFAGVGTLFAGSFAADHGTNFFGVIAIAAVAGFGVGIAVGLCSVRIRGITLAVVTIVAANAIQGLWFTPHYSVDPVVFPPVDIFGWTLRNTDVGMYFLGAATLTVGATVLWRIRVSALGRRLLAIRASERAAAAGGLFVNRTKLVVFGLSAAVAAVGGVIFGYGVTGATGDSFSAFGSIAIVTFVVLNGVGVIGGGIAAISVTIGPALFDTVGLPPELFGVLGGLAMMAILVIHPDGLLVRSRRTRTEHDQESTRTRLPSERLEVGAVTEAVDAATSPTTPQGANGSLVPLTTEPGGVLLDAANIVVRFGGNEAVSDVSLQVRDGEIVGLVGPNGAGKTTLFDALTGFVRPTSGTVNFLGESLNRLAPHQRARRGLRRTFQGAELFNDLTVEDNLRAVATLPAAEVDRILDRLGLLRFADTLASETPVGLRRRVDIGRALADHPRVVLLDEPGAGLSSGEKEDLAAMLRSVCREDGISLLLVDHDLDLVTSTCDRMYVLALGKVIMSGTPHDVMRDDNVAEAYLGVP